MRKDHVAYWEKSLALVNDSDAWRKELERYFWRSNFLTGDAAKKFIDRQAAEFRVLWAEIGVKK